MAKPPIDIYNKNSEHMDEIASGTVDLVVTSPPYPMIERWDDLFIRWLPNETISSISDDPISHNPRLMWKFMHLCLSKVWEECYRVLTDGGIMCINIGDAVRTINDTFTCWPNHAKTQLDCIESEFTPLVPVHWKKPTNSPNPFIGSGMRPPNAYVSLDTEYILVFRKGGLRQPDPEVRDASRYTIEERDEWFTQQWTINGTDTEHAAFPDEIPYRLIRMFSVNGDTVLDPFCGTGTTLDVAVTEDRAAVGYEIDRDVIPDNHNQFIRN